MDKKDKLVRPIAMFQAMKQKVFQLLQAEAKMTLKERQCQQWQLLFQIKGYGNFLVGKGGANTMFWIIDEGERHVGYPKELLTLIDDYIVRASVRTYSVIKASGKTVKRDLYSLEEAEKVKARKGYFICEIYQGRRKKLKRYTESLFGLKWCDIKKGK